VQPYRVVVTPGIGVPYSFVEGFVVVVRVVPEDWPLDLMGAVPTGGDDDGAVGLRPLGEP
jgi:hypothetical protein